MWGFNTLLHVMFGNDWTVRGTFYFVSAAFRHFWGGGGGVGGGSGELFFGRDAGTSRI